MKSFQGFRVEWHSHAHSGSESRVSQSQARIQKVNRDYVCITHATPVDPHGRLFLQSTIYVMLLLLRVIEYLFSIALGYNSTDVLIFSY